MRHLVFLCALLAAMVSAHAQAPALSGADPLTLRDAQWIWFPEADPSREAPVATRHFRTRFELSEPPRSATWLLTADDAHVAYVNGERVAESNHWPSADRVDVTRHLQAGPNVLAVSAFNGAGPGGLIGKLQVVTANGESRRIVTGKDWRTSREHTQGWTDVGFDDARWSSAKELGAAGAQPWGAVGPAEQISPDEDFPRFIVPGHQPAMESLRDLYWLHYRRSGPHATLWDEWLPPAALWPAAGRRLALHQRWAEALTTRRIDAAGYVSTHQHDGTGHALGWPFPLWHQGRGEGWHFVGTGVGGYEPPALVEPKQWTLNGAQGDAVDKLGWNIRIVAPHATAQPPGMSVEVYDAPFVRLNWRAAGLERAQPYLEWTTRDAPEFAPERRAHFAPATGDGEIRTMIPLYTNPQWRGTITGLRINFGNDAPGASVSIKSLHTAYDTRHNVNNFNYVRGVAWHLNWTKDLAALRANAGRARAALAYAIDEFQTRQRKLVFTPWVGHEGTTGVERTDGGKVIHSGRGIGANYWDLMPFGGEDALATIYCYDALRDWADVEQAIAEHPEWNVPDSSVSPDYRAEGAVGAAPAFDPADLRRHADEIKSFAGQRFWNEQAGRFVGAIDREGVAHDYGFTFLNTEAIYLGFATDEQAAAITSWLAGDRAIAGDTSTGADIYHFRFAPRSTTRRNLGWYVWPWSHAESIPWGYQVQDGGAVLGWSYHDLMARLMTRGPDDAWQRLAAIVAWFDEVQFEGGYRAYYRDPSRGTLQGANTAGGLGMDKEFVESVLVPQVMLYGFLGFEPTPTGCTINPRLPKDWPSLTITNIALHDAILDVTATADEITVTPKKRPREPLTITTNGKAPAMLKTEHPVKIK